MSAFDGKVVIVTGGAQGIGLATAAAFTARGAMVVVWDRKGERPVDVLDVESVRDAAAAVLARHGRVDVLVNNAGASFGEQGAVAIADRTWDAMMGANLKGTANTVRALGPAMIARGQGRIINTSSVLARFPLPAFAAYAAAKAGVETLTRAWARELGPHGITVNAVAPGFIDTPMNAGQGADVIAEIVARTPAGRRGRAEDVANLHLFLASEEAAFINGAIVPVDGGLTL